MKNAVCIVLFASMGCLFTFAEERTPVFEVRSNENVETRRLDLQIRLSEPVVVREVKATADGQEFPVEYTAFGSSDEDTSAILYLIDKSDPKRAQTIEAAKALTLRLIGLAGPSTRNAVYAFDANLTLVTDFGAPPAEVAARLKPVKAVGLATELYRTAIEAIEILEKQPVGHRALMLFSDGKAEDTTFTLEQVVAAARKAGVVIYGVGYAETPQSTVNLQSLRRLAAETGGPFAEADRRTRLVPEDFVGVVHPLLSSGGHASIDLSSMKAGKQVELTIQTEGRPTYQQPLALSKLAVEPKPEPLPDPKMPDSKKVEEVANTVQDVAKKVEEMARQVAGVPSKVEDAAKKAEEEQKAGEEKQALAERRRDVEQQKQQKYWIVGGVLLVLLALAGFIQKQRRRQALSPATVENAPVFARLQLLDGDATEHLMHTTALRVGRGKDNDLMLGNDSVSRHHAEISRTREGAFTITELNAGNGVLVNGKPVQKTTLNNEDIIELGEVRIRFLIG